eukprot:SAG31_NODE_4008_length_3669_cov_4.750420_4_plen_64_part_00
MDWAADDFSRHEPADGRYLPLNGLIGVLTWAQLQGRSRQRELIGQSPQSFPRCKDIIYYTVRV